MIITIPSRGPEYPEQIIEISSDSGEALYAKETFEAGIDWETYKKLLGDGNTLIVTAEKALLEVINISPEIAALILPLALEMTQGDTMAASNFQDIVEDHSEKILEEDIEQNFSNLASLYGSSLRMFPLWPGTRGLGKLSHASKA